MSTDRPVRLAPEYARLMTTESYGARPAIDGVQVTELRKHRSENGAFMELLRLDNGAVRGHPDPLRPQQFSVSWAAPGRVNAFHVHLCPQNELWCAVSGQLAVWLVDCREGSRTLGIRSPFLLSAEQPALLYIPSGVAHGYRAGPQGATLLYAADAQFNAADPDEGRLPWDTFGADLWSENRG